MGLITEIHFIARALNQPMRITLQPFSDEKYLSIRVSPDGLLNIWYADTHIWYEKIDDFFGVESCDTISRIISCISSNDESWFIKYPSPMKIF